MADGVGISDGFAGHSIPSPAPAPRQNWILDPVQDTAFIIAAPLLVLSVAISAFFFLGALAATTLIITAHIVMTVAHHLPTFIRIYGDVGLFAEHKWTFLLAPLLPFAISMSAGAYLIAQDLPIENLLYVFLFAVLWDPWHFLMQHYGFMRIYDRHNAAPRRLAARMDLLLCASWFIAIMLASGDWLTGLMQDLYRSASLPLILALPMGAVPVLQVIAEVLALATTAAYVVYLLWCRRHGYFISRSKLALFAVTFGVMALAYTPNAWIMTLAPGWSFKAGFAAVGIVHMTQYLAIVWRYNRGLVAQPERARAGIFRKLHLRGGWLIGGAYVLLCLAYGESLTAEWDSRWLMALLISLGLTSTLMHYYFDGFIWKLRQKSNRENLDLPALSPHEVELSKPTSNRGAPHRVMLRQLAYFGLPLALLSYGAASVWSGAHANYVGHLLQAHVLSKEGRATDAATAARKAFDAMNRQLPFERRITDMQPTAAREASLALLIYNQSRFEQIVLPSLDGKPISAAQLAAHLARIDEAARLLDQALSREESLAHEGREHMSGEDGERLLASWVAEIERAKAKLH